MWQTIIHMAFIVSAIGIAWIDRIMQPTTKALRAHGAPAHLTEG